MSKLCEIDGCNERAVMGQSLCAFHLAAFEAEHTLPTDEDTQPGEIKDEELTRDALEREQVGLVFSIANGTDSPDNIIRRQQYTISRQSEKIEELEDQIASLLRGLDYKDAHIHNLEEQLEGLREVAVQNGGMLAAIRRLIGR